MKHLEEKPFNTEFNGRIHAIREKSVSVQLMNDGECFLIVPLNRVPKDCLELEANVKVFLTTRHGHFGIHKLNDL